VADPAGVSGCTRACHRASSAYMFPMPAIIVWSKSADFMAIFRFAKRLASKRVVNSRDSGSGPRRC